MERSHLRADGHGNDRLDESSFLHNVNFPAVQEEGKRLGCRDVITVGYPVKYIVLKHLPSGRLIFNRPSKLWIIWISGKISVCCLSNPVVDHDACQQIIETGTKIMFVEVSQY